MKSRGRKEEKKKICATSLPSWSLYIRGAQCFTGLILYHPNIFPVENCTTSSLSSVNDMASRSHNGFISSYPTRSLSTSKRTKNDIRMHIRSMRCVIGPVLDLRTVVLVFPLFRSPTPVRTFLAFLSRRRSMTDPGIMFIGPTGKPSIPACIRNLFCDSSFFLKLLNRCTDWYIIDRNGPNWFRVRSHCRCNENKGELHFGVCECVEEDGWNKIGWEFLRKSEAGG